MIIQTEMAGEVLRTADQADGNCDSRGCLKTVIPGLTWNLNTRITAKKRC